MIFEEILVEKPRFYFKQDVIKTAGDNNNEKLMRQTINNRVLDVTANTRSVTQTVV